MSGGTRRRRKKETGEDGDARGARTNLERSRNGESLSLDVVGGVGVRLVLDDKVLGVVQLESGDLGRVAGEGGGEEELLALEKREM